MKLKSLVVASMSAFGLISGVAFADDAATTTAPAHHKHHHKHKAHHVAQSHDYKAMGGLAVQPAAMAEDTYTATYDAMGQNSNRGRPAADWFNRVGMNGGVNFDAHWGNRSTDYRGEDESRVSLNDAYLNTSANVNDWTKAFISLSYNSSKGNYSTVTTADTLAFEQGYITIANYDEYPGFFQIGKQYTDFGRYTIHPMMRSMTQVMSESLATSAKLGFITKMGLHGQVYAFDNALKQTGFSNTKPVYGATIGFDQPNDQLGYDVGLGYMSNLTGVNDVAASLNTASFVHTVGGVAVYADVNSGPFNVSGRYTTAIQHFSAADMSTVLGSTTASGARPWAADLTAGYGFNAMNKNQNVYVGYQTSNNAVNLALPKNRWLAGYGIDMWKNTSLGLEVAHDTAYSSGNGGTGNSSNVIGARASVKFG